MHSIARRGFSVVVVVVVIATLAFGCKKSAEAPKAGTPENGVPTASELNAFVTNAGRVHLRMTEDQVTEALGTRPSRREDPTSPGAATTVVWDSLPGENPGGALATFYKGKLARIEFVSARMDMPRIPRDAARSLAENADVVRRSVARTLRMSEIEAVTGSRGLHNRWILADKWNGETMVMSRWMWEVEPGGEALIVDEEDGAAGQPIVRSLQQ